MKIGHVFLSASDDAEATSFAELVAGLDGLAIDQHVLVSRVEIARQLEDHPHVTVGPLVRSPVMACCLLPSVDLAHVHGDKGGQTGLLLTLTRSIPFVMSAETRAGQYPLQRSIHGRAQRIIEPGERRPDQLAAIYRETLAAWSKLPEDADSR